MKNVFVDKFSRTARRDTFRSVTRRTARGAACASLLGAVALTLFSGGVNAATATGTLAVSATVIASCTVSGGAINFGSNINPTASTTLSGAGNLGVKCSTSTPFSVSLDAGTNAGGATAFAARKVRNNGVVPTTTMGYQLYTDAARTQIFGDSTGSTSLASGTGTGAFAPVNIYGTLNDIATASPGAYTDTVVITVTY